MNKDKITLRQLDSLKRSSLSVLRWIGIIPVFVFVFFGVSIAAGLATSFSKWFLSLGDSSGWEQVARYIAAPVVSSVMAIETGIKIAPKGKKVVGIILWIFVIIIQLLVISGNIISEKSNTEIAIPLIGALAAIIFSGFLVFGKQKK